MSHPFFGMRYGLAIVIATLTITASAQTADKSDDKTLVSLEQSKWTPSSYPTLKEFSALFAADFISVEYGNDTSSGVQRKTRDEVFNGPPLKPATFVLTDFKVIHPSADSAIVSYMVTGTSFKWRAYATSVWARRHGKWLTVFYQASTAR